MSIENTDLERRVLAHEQILQALMAQIAESQPGFLNRMSERFAGVRRGAHEHDYVETADYAEAFLLEVLRLGGAGTPRQEASPAGVQRQDEVPSGRTASTRAALIRASPNHGVWRVVVDGVFSGDYLTEAVACAAAAQAAAQIRNRGGRVELILGSQS